MELLANKELVEGVFLTILGGCLLLQTYVDYRWQLLLDELNLVIGMVGIAYAQLFLGLQEGLAGSLVLGGALGLIYFFSKGGLGLGDVKLGLALGLWLGGYNSWLCFLLALLLGAAVGGLGWLLGKLKPQNTMAFGPFIGIAAAVVIWKGYELQLLLGLE